MSTLNARLTNPVGTAAEWTAENPTLLAGEIGVESDTGKFKVGDGTTVWSGLDYAQAEAGASALDDLSDVSTAGGLAGQVLTQQADSTFALQTPASGVTDHGLLDGLADDDHPQYLRVDSGAYVASADVGVPDGVASLDGNGKVPDAQLPAVTNVWAAVAAQKLSVSTETVVTFTEPSAGAWSDYRAFRLTITGAQSTSGATALRQLQLTFNGDTSENYQWLFDSRSTHGSTGALSTLAAGADGTTGIRLAYIPGAGAPDGAIVVAHIGNDGRRKVVTADVTSTTADTTYKLWRGWFGGSWNNTDLITSMSVTMSIGNYIAGAAFRLEGLMDPLA